MKRGPGPRRKTALRADPAKTRAFVDRGRSFAFAKAKLKPAPVRKPHVADPTRAEMWAWRVAVWQLDEGRCTVTGLVCWGPEDRRFHAHHVLSQHELRARGLREYRADPRLGVWLSDDAHERHENASRRVPWTALPARVWDVARELDGLAGTAWATELILRLHPTRRAPGDARQEGR